ncbi:MAG: four helix bundle protein [Myxococcales bacterium]|nr:four helix bundle protein [Myxococcales bacterium]
MRLIAFDLALELVRSLRPTLAAYKRHNARIARQLEDAVSSIPLNIAEATGRFGRDRTYHFRVALGSLREVSAALEVGQPSGDPSADGRRAGARRGLQRGSCRGTRGPGPAPFVRTGVERKRGTRIRRALGLASAGRLGASASASASA